MPWLTGWNRRKSKIVNGTSSLQTNYPIKLTIHKGNGTDTPTDIYLGNYVRNDFGDVRFTTSDGTTLISYWIESITSGISCICWIKIPSIPITGTAIYIYYDYPTQTSISNGNNTFAFFDDFNTGVLDTTKWSIFTLGQWVTFSGGALMLYSGEPDPGGYGGAVITKNPIGDGVLEFRHRTGSTANRWNQAYIGMRGASTHVTYIRWDGSDIILGGGLSGSTSLGVNTSWRDFKIVHNNGIFQLYMDNVLKINTTFDPSLVTSQIYLGSADNGTGKFFDNVRVRRYVTPEPTYGASGTEELNIEPKTIDISSNICLGECSITSNVSWQNNGASNITFIPAIKIDDAIIVYGASEITIPPGGIGFADIPTPTLPVGTHSICPYPNI